MDKNKYYCRINGIIHNLEDIQKLLDAKEDGSKITMAMNENHGMDFMEALLFDEVIEFNNNKIPSDYNECLERMREHNSRSHSNNPTIKCPTCGSTKVKRISTTSKVVGATMFGLFSKTARSQFECLDCKYKW